MRLPAQGLSEGAAGVSNQFSKFLCPDVAPRQESTLMPPRTVLDQMKSMSKTNKRRVITSDDEDGPVESRSPKKVASKGTAQCDTPSSVEWVQSRKPSHMSQHERETNVQKALDHRKQHNFSSKVAGKIIAKVAKPKLACDGSDDDILDHSTPYAEKAALRRALEGDKNKGGYKSALLQEALVDDQDAELEARRRHREEAAAAERLQRAAGRTFAGRTFNSSSSALASPNNKAASSSSPSVLQQQSKGVLLQDIYKKGHSQLEAIELDDDSDDDVVVVRRPKGSATSVSGSSSSSRRGEGAAGSGSSSRSRRRAAAAAEASGEEDREGGNNSGSGDENGYGSDLDRSQLQALANKVLQQCDALSRNLRQSLIQWETGADDAVCAEAAKSALNTSRHFAGSSSTTAGAAQGSRDCVDLTTINIPGGGGSGGSSSSGSGGGGAVRSSSKQILYDEDIATLCPELCLKGYQLVGVNWLKLLHQHNVNGVLADDMGLGKTVQTIAFLGWLASAHPTGSSGQRKTPRPHLIVVPASTLSNWEIELRRFCPSFQVLTYHGSQSERATLRYEIRSERATPDVILTTYTIFERESNKADRAFMQALQLEYLVLDEAHGIKNALSSRFVNLNVLKTRHRLLLSGTPVQNDIGELLSMLSFLMPQVFGRENRELLIEALSWSTAGVGGASTAQQQQGDLSLAQLRSMLAPFVLRRLKRDVLDQLTDKATEVRRLTMTPFQRQVYDGILLGHAARKDMLKLKQRADDEAESILQDKMRGRATAAPSDPDSKKAVGKPAPVNIGTGATGSSAAEGAAECVSPFNKKQRKEVVSLLSDDETSCAVGAKTAVRTKSGTVSSSASASSASTAVTAFPSEIDLAAIAESSVDTADIDLQSAAALDSEAAAAAALQSLSASEASNLFAALRKAANHPLLLRVRYRDPKVLEKISMIAHSLGHFGNQCDYQRVRDEIDGMSDFDIHQLCLEYDALRSLQLDASALYDSPKMELLRTLLPQLQREGHRVLVFSQWTRLLDLLEVLLQDINMRYLRLDGSTPVKTRQGLIDEFNADAGIPVFLLSTKAGGLGINLTAADTVVLHDLDFNPENDRQAEDRCHRIGQTRPVTVYKLFAEETVDEDIYDMGERKSRLSKAVLQDDRQRQQQGTPGSETKRARKSSKGAVGAEGGGEGEESSAAAISSILQKALLRRVHALAAEGK